VQLGGGVYRIGERQGVQGAAPASPMIRQMIASFSRALLEGLSDDQTDDQLTHS
jgi:fructose-bisphosphate aldolase class 1